MGAQRVSFMDRCLLLWRAFSETFDLSRWSRLVEGSRRDSPAAPILRRRFLSAFWTRRQRLGRPTEARILLSWRRVFFRIFSVGDAWHLPAKNGGVPRGPQLPRRRFSEVCLPGKRATGQEAFSPAAGPAYPAPLNSLMDNLIHACSWCGTQPRRQPSGKDFGGSKFSWSGGVIDRRQVGRWSMDQ